MARSIALTIGFLLTMTPCSARGAANDQLPRTDRRSARVDIPFVENQGQSHPDVAFHAQLRDGTVFVTRSGSLVYVLRDGAEADIWTTLVETPRRAGQAAPSGRQRSNVEVSYFLGSDQDRWRSGVATYDSVALGPLNRRVELDVEMHDGAIEKRFHVDPGGRPETIWIEVKGARRLAVEPDGRLAITTAVGTVHFSRPVAYQVVGSTRREVSVRYRPGARGYGFTVGPYDRSTPLVIDPVLSTFVGGTGTEYGVALTTHHTAANDLWVYFAGWTSSVADYPFATEPGGVHSGSGGGGGQDALVARLPHDLSLLRVAFLGGNGKDQAWDLAVHPDTGAVFVVGLTAGGFPMTGATAVGRGSLNDGFIARLSADLSTLDASRYLGGDDNDNLVAVTIEKRTDGVPDLVYVAGGVKSDDMPGAAGSPQPAKAGGRSYNDGFAAVLDTDLQLIRATYLGGHSDDQAYAIAVSPLDHRVFVAGQSSYDPMLEPPELMYVGCFPWIADQTSFGGEVDAFVVRLADRLAGSETPLARYVGGLRMDSGQALAIEPSSGEVFLAGASTCAIAPATNDAEFPFPAAPYQPAQAVCEGAVDAYVVRLGTDLTLVASTLLGGQYQDRAYGVAYHLGRVYVVGRTESNDFPWTDGAADPESVGGESVIAALSPNLTQVYQATYLGGASLDESLGHGLAVANDPHTGSLWTFVVGETESDDFPGIPDVPDVVPQRVRGGSFDAFVARMPASLQASRLPEIDVEPALLDLGNVAIGASVYMPVELRNLGAAPLHVLHDMTVIGDPMFGVQANGTCEGLAPTLESSTSCTVYASFTPTALGRYTAALWIESDDSDEPAVHVQLIGRTEPDVELLPEDPGHEPGFAFPDVAEGTTFYLPFTIRNAGASPLSLTGVVAAGIEPTLDTTFTLRFGEGPASCARPSAAEPVVLAPGQDCAVTVVFAPPIDGPHEGVAFVWSDDPDENPAFMHFWGEGLEPSARPVLVLDAEVDFGTVGVGESHSLILLAANRGGAPLQIRGYELSDPRDFSVDPAMGAMPCATAFTGVEVGGYCTYGVTFAPVRATTGVSETLEVRSNDPIAAGHTVQLLGRSTEATGGDAPADGAPGSRPSGGCSCSAGSVALFGVAAALRGARRKGTFP